MDGTPFGRYRLIELLGRAAQTWPPLFQRLSRRNRIAVGAVTLAVVAVVATGIGVVSAGHEKHPSQVVLPFTGLNHPSGVAVDGAGTIYVADFNNNRVLKLPAGSSTQEVLPFTLLNNPEGVGVDAAGSVYVTEYNSYERDTGRVAKLAGGTGPQTELALTGLKAPEGIAVDGAGNVYVAVYGNQQVVKLPAR